MSTVSVRKTKGDDYEAIKAAVYQVLEDLGGIEDIIKPGYKVIIKPNLVACPTDRLSGGITRWEVCLALYEKCKEIGAEPVIAESSAAGADTELTINKCGYQDLRDQGIPVINLKDKANATCKVDIENGVVFDKINTWEMVRDCDAIITVPVMKTHDQTEVTLGMKNLKGLLVDTQKKDFHKKGLIEGVVDWCSYLKPCLEIIDGTYGQQGLGPIFGETKEMDLIVGSKDLVACEAVTSKIMGYEPEDVMITRAAYKRGLGEMDLEKIEVIGKQIDEVASRFKRSSEVEIEGIPESFNLIFSKDACTGCHNTVISSLMDMKAQDLFSYLEGMNVCVGPVTKEMLPEGANADNTVCIGVCCKKLADECGFRWVVGCPPGNADTVKGILGDRREYGVRYE
ncbi:MAG: DUF362 domain-containing protein [Firmicutes bacterium]|nr:DUF362 domain-containing protein [Bacillota bacterium]